MRDALRESVDDLVALVGQLGGKVASLEELKRRLGALPWATGDEDSLRTSVEAILAAYRRGDYGAVPAAAKSAAFASGPQPAAAGAPAADPTPAIQARIDQLRTQLVLLENQITTKISEVAVAQSAYDQANAVYQEWLAKFRSYADPYQADRPTLQGLIDTAYASSADGYYVVRDLGGIATVGELRLNADNMRSNRVSADNDAGLARGQRDALPPPADAGTVDTVNAKAPGERRQTAWFSYWGADVDAAITYSYDPSRDYPAAVEAVVRYNGQSVPVASPVAAKKQLHATSIYTTYLDPKARAEVRNQVFARISSMSALAASRCDNMLAWWDWQVKRGIAEDRKAALDALVAAKAALEAARDKRAQCKTQLDAAKAELAAAKAQDWQAQLDRASADRAAEEARLAAADQDVTAAQNGVAAVQAEFDGQQLVITLIVNGGAGATVGVSRTADVFGRTFTVTFRSNAGETRAQMEVKLAALVDKIQRDVLVNRIDYADGYVEQYAWYADAATRKYPVLVWGKWSRGGRTFGTGNVFKCANEEEKERVKAAIAAEAAAVKATEESSKWKEIEGGLFVRHYRKYGADGLAECWTLVNSGTGREASNTVVVGRTGRLDARGVHDAEVAAEASALGWGRTPVSYNGGTYRLFGLPDGRTFAKYQVAAGGRWWTTPNWSDAAAMERECRSIVDGYVAKLAALQRQGSVTLEMRATVEDESVRSRGAEVRTKDQLRADFQAQQAKWLAWRQRYSQVNLFDVGLQVGNQIAIMEVPEDVQAGFGEWLRAAAADAWEFYKAADPKTAGIGAGIAEAVEGKVREYADLLDFDFDKAYGIVSKTVGELYGLATDPAKRDKLYQDAKNLAVEAVEAAPVVAEGLVAIAGRVPELWSNTSEFDRYRICTMFVAVIGLEVWDPLKKVKLIRLGEIIHGSPLRPIARALLHGKDVLAKGWKALDMHPIYEFYSKGSARIIMSAEEIAQSDFKSMKRLQVAISMVKPEPGYRDIFIHSDGHVFNYYFKGDYRPVGFQEIAQIIKSDGPLQPLRLVACKSGAKLNAAGPTIAEYMATSLGIPVIAPTTVVRVNEAGHLTLEADEVTGLMGAWKSFNPAAN